MKMIPTNTEDTEWMKTTRLMQGGLSFITGIATGLFVGWLIIAMI